VTATEVDVWLAAPSGELACRGAALLSAEERARDALFQHAGAREQFLVGRWLLRTVVGARLGLAPEAVPLVEVDRGALAVPVPSNPGDVRFNLSHTDGLVAVAITAGREVGVDVEDTRRRGRTVELADRFFSPEEVTALRALPAGAAQRDRFFRLWTLKESYIKARGQGLAIPLAGFRFTLDEPGATINFSARPGVDPDPTRWRFVGLRPTRRHQLAVAVASAAPLRVRVRWAG